MKINSAVLVAAAVFFLLANGCVSKSSFEMMESEASRLANELKNMGNRHETLKDEHHDLIKEKEALELEKTKLVADNKHLNLILEARSDSLSETISKLREEMADQDTEHEAEVGGLGERLDRLEAENFKLREEIKELKREKEEEVEKVSSTYENLLARMKNEIEQGQVTISELKGKLTVNMVDAILFDSGKAQVKEEGMTVLRKVVDILKNVTDKNIRIEGHTDDVKITGALAQKFPSNWELSARRAVNVAKFLQKHGVNPENMAAVAYGEHHPIADNVTEEGRALNRRIEIILVDKDRW